MFGHERILASIQPCTNCLGQEGTEPAPKETHYLRYQLPICKPSPERDVSTRCENWRVSTPRRPCIRLLRLPDATWSAVSSRPNCPHDASRSTEVAPTADPARSWLWPYQGPSQLVSSANDPVSSQACPPAKLLLNPWCHVVLVAAGRPKTHDPASRSLGPASVRAGTRCPSRPK
jgi:hypothetical protein